MTGGMAGTLRRAADLMRKRAETASPGPWVSHIGGGWLKGWEMHPGVALAVADWLDYRGCQFETAMKCGIAYPKEKTIAAIPDNANALAVARAYLGEEVSGRDPSE